MKTKEDLIKIIKERSLLERKRNELILIYNLEIGPYELKKSELNLKYLKELLELPSYMNLEDGSKREVLNNLEKTKKHLEQMKKYYDLSVAIMSSEDLEDEVVEELDTLFDSILNHYIGYLYNNKEAYKKIRDAYIDSNLEMLKENVPKMDEFINQEGLDDFYLNEEIQMEALNKEFPLNSKDRILDSNKLNLWKSDLDKEIKDIEKQILDNEREIELHKTNDGFVS